MIRVALFAVQNQLPSSAMYPLIWLPEFRLLAFQPLRVSQRIRDLVASDGATQATAEMAHSTGFPPFLFGFEKRARVLACLSRPDSLIQPRMSSSHRAGIKMGAKSSRTQQQAESRPSQKSLNQGRLVIASSLPGPSRPSFVLKGRPHLFFARVLCGQTCSHF